MKDKLIISIVVGVFIIAVYYYIFPTPKEEKTNETTQKEITEMEEKLNSQKNTETGFSKKDEIDAEISSLKQEMKQISSVFPSDPEIPKLLRYLANIGDTCGLQFLLFEPQPPKNEGFYEEIPIKLKLRGTFAQVAVFFDGVSKMDRLVSFEGIKIAGHVNYSESTMTETDALMITYRLIGEM